MAWALLPSGLVRIHSPVLAALALLALGDPVEAGSVRPSASARATRPAKHRSHERRRQLLRQRRSPVVFLTGRRGYLRAASIAQLEAMGFAAVSDRLITKPEGTSTPAFKTAEVKKLLAAGGRVAMVEDFRLDLRALAGLPVHKVAIEFPVNQPAAPAIPADAAVLIPSR